MDATERAKLERERDCLARINDAFGIRLAILEAETKGLRVTGNNNAKRIKEIDALLADQASAEKE